MPDYRLADKANKASPTFTGQATIPTINLTSGQIAFPATAVPSADANTLDDYEEGTWTPGVGSLTVVGAFTSGGTYTKIGRKVTLIGWVAGATSVSGAASTYMSNQPFTPAGTSIGCGTNASYTITIGVLSYTNTNIYIVEGFAATPQFIFTITYEI